MDPFFKLQVYEYDEIFENHVVSYGRFGIFKVAEGYLAELTPIVHILVNIIYNICCQLQPELGGWESYKSESWLRELRKNTHSKEMIHACRKVMDI